jgi:hypothetical protein
MAYDGAQSDMPMHVPACKTHLGGGEGKLLSIVGVCASHDLGVVQVVVLEAALGLILGLAILALHANESIDESCQDTRRQSCALSAATLPLFHSRHKHLKQTPQHSRSRFLPELVSETG